MLECRRGINCPFSTFIFDFYSIAHYITTSLFSKCVQKFLIIFIMIFFLSPVIKCPALNVSRLVQTSPKSCVTSPMDINAICSFSCPQGYKLEGPSSTQCGLRGVWTEDDTVICIGELWDQGTVALFVCLTYLELCWLISR